jgi:hypothetical protein
MSISWRSLSGRRRRDENASDLVDAVKPMAASIGAFGVQH